MILGGSSRMSAPWPIVAGLVVVIVIAAAMLIHGIFAPDPTQAPPRAQMHFQCGLCGRAFIKTPQEFRDATAMPDEHGHNPSGLIDCPHCGGKGCSGTTVQCGKCGKQFLPITLVRPPGDDDTVRPGEPNSVCPHCKTDRIQWAREQYEKQKQDG